MTPASLTVAPLASLPDRALAGGAVLAPAGAYQRLCPFCIDLDDADPASHRVVSVALSLRTQAYDPTLLVRLPGALVCGQGAVVACDGSVIEETVLEFTIHDQIPQGLQSASAGLHLVAPRCFRRRGWRTRRTCSPTPRSWSAQKARH